ncbi:MAG: GNAT family N-acetyltransferase [Pseudomonadota bacterium]
MSFSVEKIETRGQFDQLAGQWNTLLENSEASSIFLTFEWISSWLDVLPSLPELFVLVVRDAHGALAAIAPFYVARHRLLGCKHYRCLRVLGDWQTGAEHQDVLVRRDALAARDVLYAALADARTDFDWIWLPYTQTETGAAARGEALAALCGGFSYAREFEYLSVSLPESIELYRQRLSKSTASNFRRQEKALGGRYRVLEMTEDRAHQLDDWLDTLFHLHTRRWQIVGKPGSFVKQPLLQPFYRRFAAVALQNNWLKFYRLDVDGKPVAMQFGYGFNDRLLSIQEGFEPDAPSGSGNVLRMMVIRRCIDESISTYDFLAHGSKHKQRWRGQVHAGQSLFFGTQNWSNLPLRWLPFWPTGRFIRHLEP